MAQFSSNSAVSLEKSIDTPEKLVKTPLERVDTVYEIQKCITWIKTNNFRKICLQFPDKLLPDSSQVASRIQKGLNDGQVYILADTAYESCCIDYVAAAHASADSIIHFGPVCFSKNSGKIPSLNVYEKTQLDLKLFLSCFKEKFISGDQVVVLLDCEYVHLQGDFSEVLPSEICVRTVDGDLSELNDKVVVFLGENSRKLANLQFGYGFKPKALYSYNSSSNAIMDCQRDEKMLRRRYFLVEKIKDSATVGIVIGTLAVKNYLKVIERVKKLATLHGKKYYVISVGKPTVAKLANFPEIDVYVIITCAMNEIYDSRDYYKPIVMPYDVEIALNPKSSQLPFTFDFNDFITSPLDDKLEDGTNEVSLLTGNMRQTVADDGDVEMEEGEGRVILKTEGTLALNTKYGSGYLASRSWTGLEQNLGESEVKMVEEERQYWGIHFHVGLAWSRHENAENDDAIVLERVKRPVVIVAAGMIPLFLPTLITILKSSFSYLTALKQFYYN